MKFLKFFTLTLLCLTSFGWSNSDELPIQKMYIDCGQVEIIDNGILLFEDEFDSNPVYGYALASDEDGLYMEIPLFFCPFPQHRRCRTCGNCLDRRCAFRCIANGRH